METRLLAAIAAARAARGPQARLIVALAGAPASGKSTLAAAAVARLNAEGPGTAALLPMDGFHFDDTVLAARGLLARKGAPETFDVAGLAHMLTRLRAREPDIAIPIFDRRIEIARAGAAIIPAGAQVILAEGNYLTLARAPWGGLAPLFDLSVRLDQPEEVLRARLMARWDGLARSEAARRIAENDLPNGRLVAAESRPVDLVLRP
ncbi:nucleoside/nucleotide kinase family protein [Phaeovulum vinaykumarii]|uniref:Panthothenate kinase n=1 Tax=Phaeovulum vinaykumarii TaxID=407234 RepID=A0A1N7M1L6_9RHOB|nr:hypothetical protein [Phaeovulum vinaykumarii]SIS79947.1 Panthothenate kinase [Phaeovulum vinaykumarii]SOC09482.1 panthothenate kinase [Phaeovulum vinaykumarii]